MREMDSCCSALAMATLSVLCKGLTVSLEKVLGANALSVGGRSLVMMSSHAMYGAGLVRSHLTS